MKLRSVFFGLLLVACVATPLRAQYLAQPAVSADCGTAQTCTAKLAINVTAGNSLIAVIRLTAITSLSGTTITDTRSNSWVLDSWILQSTNLHILAVYRVASANAGATSLTVSNSATSTTRIVGLAEISGLASGAPSAQVSAVGSGTVAMPGTIATTQANEYVLLAAATDNNQSYTSLQPFLVEADVTRGAYADAIPTQPATLTPEISYSVSDDWLAIALAYKTTGTPRLPIFLTLHYDDGTPVTGNVVLYSLANGTKTSLQSWTIASNGQVSIYCPIVSSGSYEYDFLDPSGNLLQSYMIMPGAFISLITPAHSLQSTITLSKSTHNITIPVSFAFQ